MTPDLSPAEVDRICNGLRQNAAKVRFLRRLGVPVERRPDGSPLVRRVDWERRGTAAHNDDPAGSGPAWRKSA